jgi:hypothetical protein
MTKKKKGFMVLSLGHPVDTYRTSFGTSGQGYKTFYFVIVCDTKKARVFVQSSQIFASKVVSLPTLCTRVW